MLTSGIILPLIMTSEARLNQSLILKRIKLQTLNKVALHIFYIACCVTTKRERLDSSLDLYELRMAWREILESHVAI